MIRITRMAIETPAFAKLARLAWDLLNIGLVCS